MEIAVPLHVRARIARENLVKATLHTIHNAGDQGFPVEQLRAGFKRLGVEPDLAQYVENRLVREGIVTERSGRLFIGTLESIKAFLARSKWDESRVAAIAPEDHR